MSKLVKLFLVPTLWVAFSGMVFAAEDRVEINRVFATTDGRFAVQATSIPTSADTEGNCHSGNADWARYWFGFVVNEQSQSIVATLLSAKARGVSVKLVSSGCLGDWHHIQAVYSG